MKLRCWPFNIIFVDANAPPGGVGSYARLFQTITEAANAAGHGTTISIESGNHQDAPITLFKRDKIKVTNGINGPAVIE